MLRTIILVVALIVVVIVYFKLSKKVKEKNELK